VILYRDLAGKVRILSGGRAGMIVFVDIDDLAK
jgi:hypothetical protein